MENKFQELGLNENILKAIADLGYEKPSAVQENVIPKLLDKDFNNDIVCLAQTGTGKTASFGLPALQNLNPEMKKPQVLVLSPTRELARQIAQDIKSYAKYEHDIYIVPVYGGSSIDAQIRLLNKGTHIVVATPGRMLDLLKRGAVNVSQVKTLILDEADEMLNMGFKEELDAILQTLPQERHTLLFSATLPIAVEKIAKDYMSDPEIITIGTRNSSSKNVKHYYFAVHAKDRYAALKRIVDYNPDIYGIIFCRTRQETQEIADSLVRDGYDADALHGELSQYQRDQVMKRFKQGQLKLLVATDVAARGIDVNNLSHVINYNLPDDPEQYTHRSGRTGRADKTGVSYVIINTKEKHKLRAIEKITGSEFAKAKVPGGSEICSRQLLHLIDQINKVEVRDEIKEYMPLIEEKWADMTREDILSKMLSIEFNRFLDYYRGAPDLNTESAKEEKGKNIGASKKVDKGMTWIKLNIGSKSKVTPRHIVRLFVSCGLSKKGIGKFEFRKDFMLAEISESAADRIVKNLDGSKYRGFKLRLEKVK